ncbi:hypothetical protein [Roseicitreum antarcticum]|uniref:DoxX-like family protein n=1 Tax=Roseicitreum antarcticum TaxID=564137 RepID=A0A1H3CG67_9RHOB|nr:hypothetical protein [Roseicitreum antarcticum]SDX53076.1 hypothetical protein SAMN04488238_109151 [Roseicitreum antarcticum]
MTPRTRPAHLPLTALLAILWFGLWAVEYVLVRYDHMGTLAGLPEGWGLWFDALPVWTGAVLAVGIWGGLLGAIMMLARDRGAVLILAFAFLAMLVVAVWSVLSPAGPRPLPGFDPWLVLVAQVVVPALFWFYARSMKQAGALA